MTATGTATEAVEDIPLHVVLYQPEIPQNTGNVGRTCVALGAKLWIVRPTGFRLDSSQLKRSGMDYWQDLHWEAVDHWQHLTQRLGPRRTWLITKFGERSYCETPFHHGDALVFGCETSGLPPSIHQQFAEWQVQIPMPGPARCLNLATSAGIVMYEAARRIGLLSQPLSLER